MKLCESFWIDDNGNRWQIDKYSEEIATVLSKTLINCHKCHNCRNCSYCRDCSDCSYCRSCSDCRNCSYCSNCRNCSYCRNCSDCSDCSNCRNCSYCRNCSDCSDCSYCSNCSNCRNCSYCRDCSDCSNCRSCSDCRNCSYCSDCSNCRNCSYCSNWKTNPERIVSPKIGRREDQTTIYFSADKTQVVCGCFVGTLAEFEVRVKEIHGNNEHAVAYDKWIQQVNAYRESNDKIVNSGSAGGESVKEIVR